MRSSYWSSDVCSSDLWRDHGARCTLRYAVHCPPTAVEQDFGWSGWTIRRYYGQSAGHGLYQPVRKALGVRWEGEQAGSLQDSKGIFQKTRQMYPSRSEEHTSELKKPMSISSDVHCLK